MPYKDPKKRYEASLKSMAKKPEHYKAKGREAGRRRSKRGYFLFRRYGLTLEKYNEMLIEQNGVCKMCGSPPHATSRQTMVLHVDHDHKTGKVRGLLCNVCNKALGIIENLSFMEKARVYLENNSETN